MALNTNQHSPIYIHLKRTLTLQAYQCITIDYTLEYQTKRNLTKKQLSNGKLLHLLSHPSYGCRM
jgi:hypothetical protein